MKNLRLTSLLALAAMATAGCARQEQSESADDSRAASYNGDDRVSFNMVAGQQTSGVTRAKEFTYWTVDQKLKVYSWETNTTTHFHDFELTYNAPYTTSWTYSPTVNAPGKAISYYSYYPESTNVSNFTASGHTGSFDYTAPRNTEDLMAANAWTTSPRVSMQFHHLLSEVNFAMQCLQGFKITINSITLNDVMSKGHYTFTVEGGSWDTPNTPSGYDYAPYSPVIFPTNGMNSDILYLGNKGGAAQSDNNHYNALMLLPQSFPTPAQGARMEVNYTLVDANSVPYKSGTAWAYFSDFTTKRWEPGKRYLYLIDFSGLIEDGPITFEILAMGWGDNTPQAEPIIVSEAKEPDVTKLLIEKAISQHNSNKANNPALTVFPISLRMGSLVPGPDDQIVTLKDFADGSFVRGDQIRVFCNDNALPRRFRLDPALQGSTWDLQYSTGTNYFIITKL